MNPLLFSKADSVCGSPLAALFSLIQLALDEDLGRGRTDFPGDHSSLSCFAADQQGRAVLRAKESGIVAGLPLVPLVLQAVDPELHWEALAQDGDEVEFGQALGAAHGPLTGLLTAERTLLNFVQRLSGVATAAHRWTALVDGTGVVLLDTRKTTPGWRDLEKYAVRTGGATNHRLGLYDLIMLKDNHIDFCGGLPEAVHRAQRYLKKLGHPLKIEVEARSLADVDAALDTPGIDILMLDNFTPDACRIAVKRIAGRLKTEASGGITEETLRSYAESGVDFISLGALTHSVKSLDLNFKAEVVR
jgi:nicotinate-nucleotide pyrophosphorylase (carboxylating)